MASTVTTHVTTRIPHDDADALRACASRTSSTPSAVLARLLREARRRHPDLFEPLECSCGAEGSGSVG